MLHHARAPYTGSRCSATGSTGSISDTHAHTPERRGTAAPRAPCTGRVIAAHRRVPWVTPGAHHVHARARARHTPRREVHARDMQHVGERAGNIHTHTLQGSSAPGEHRGSVAARRGVPRENAGSAPDTHAPARDTSAQGAVAASTTPARIAPGECDTHHTGSDTPRPAHHRTYVRDAPAKKTPGHRGGVKGERTPPYQGLFPGIFRNLTE